MKSIEYHFTCFNTSIERTEITYLLFNLVALEEATYDIPLSSLESPISAKRRR